MISLSRKQSGRRLLLAEQEARELRAALFRLFGKDPEYREVVTGYLRGYWRDVALPADHPDRYNFRALREQARLGTSGPALAHYVDEVERFVSHELHLNVDESPAEWAGNRVHSHVVHPEYMVKYIQTRFPGEPETWEAMLDDMVFAVGSDRWDRYDWPTEMAVDSAVITVSVSPAGAVVNVDGNEPIEFNCRPGEWMSFDDLAAVEKTARAALEGELKRLRASFQERYGKPNRNRPAFACDIQKWLPVLFRYIHDPAAPTPPDKLFKRLQRLAERIGFDLPHM